MAPPRGEGTRLGTEEEEIILMDRSSVVCLFHTNTGRVGVVERGGGWGAGFIGLESFLPLSSEISLKSGGEICCKRPGWRRSRTNAMSPLDSLTAYLFFFVTYYFEITHICCTLDKL